METLALGRMTLELPEGFHPMQASELEEAFGFTWDLWAGVRDRERHVMVAVIAREAGAVAGVLASAADAATGIERRMRQGHAPDGYEFERRLKGEVGGLRSRGFRYRFRALGIDHIGEVWCVKCERTFYSVYLYGRAQYGASVRDAFLEVLDGVSFAGPRR